MKDEIEKASIQIQKKDCKEQFATRYGDCEKFMTKYSGSIKQLDLEMYIYEYTQTCQESFH